MCDINTEIQNCNKKYPLVLIDPPYDYGDQDSEKLYNVAKKHYTTISNKELEKVNLQKILSKESLVLLWTTSPKCHFTHKLIDVWNLDYICTLINW